MANNRQPDVIAIGHLCYDNVCTAQRYPQENTSIHIEDVSNQSGGAASQALAAFARLGGHAGYLGVLGDDDTGEYLHNKLAEENIDVSHIKIIKGGKSSFTFLLVNQSSASRTIFSYHDKLPEIVFTDTIKEYISNAQFIHLDGTMYKNALNAAKIAKKSNVLVSLDGCSMQADNNKNLELIKYADILVMNEIYPCRLTNSDDIETALIKISAMGPKITVATLGDKGCLAVEHGKIKRYPAYKITPLDTTGAGDAFHGGFIYGILNKFSFDNTVKFASAVGAINCLSSGGRKGLPTLEQVNDFMKKNAFGPT